MSKLFEDIIDKAEVVDDERSASEIVVSDEESAFTEDEKKVTLNEHYRILGIIRLYRAIDRQNYLYSKWNCANKLFTILNTSRAISELSKISIEEKNDVLTMVYAFNTPDNIRIVDAIDLLTRINNAFYEKRMDFIAKDIQKMLFFKRNENMSWKNVLDFSLTKSSDSLYQLFD